jgi:hypothetical protein
MLSVLAAAPAAAQDVTVDDERTSPIVSGTDGGSNGGTITVTQNGSIVLGSGTIITLNSPHDLVLEATSVISSEDLASGRGLLLDATTQQLVADLDLAGEILIGEFNNESFDFDATTDNIGILLDGELGFEGDITITEDGSVIVYGGDSRGIFIDGPMTGDMNLNGIVRTNGNRAIAVDLNAPMTGDLTIGGQVTAIDANTVGVRIGETLDGAFIHRGEINVGQSATTYNDGNTIEGEAAVAG